MTTAENNDWIECEKELPPVDGFYEICNKENDIDLSEYDGYGFKFDGIYRNPKYWRKYKILIKKYGKQI